MTTYTWSAQTLSAAWANPSDWSVGGGATVQFPDPGLGDTAIIGYGTVTFGFSLYDIAVTLQPVPHATGVTLATAGVDLGDRALITTAPAGSFGTSIVYDVIGSGTVDDASPGNGAGLPGAIDFSAAPLTIELSANTLTADTTVTFTNAGSLSGANLTLMTPVGVGAPSAATFVNDSTINVTGAFLQFAGPVVSSPGTTLESAGVTLTGTGEVLLHGISASATFDAPVAAGQTIGFADMPVGIQLRGGVTIENLAQFLGTIELDRSNQVVVQHETSGVAGYANGVLSFNDGATLDVLPAGDTNSIVTQVVAFSDATLIDAACFAAGTRIATPRGEAPVEAIRAGDLVRLADGATASVVWVGARTVRCDRHRRPGDVWPVRVRAGAVAHGVPARDLLLSPDHAVAVSGVLVPVRHLLNGATIVQEEVAVVRYHHVELVRHALVLAEGLAAESYLDTGNRAAFEGEGPVRPLHPDFSRRVWAAEGCMALTEGGPALARVRRVLLRRAAALGYCRTADPALRVEAQGRDLPAACDGDRWRVLVPAGVRAVTLHSRAWVPTEMRAAADDRRRLGVALGRLWLDGREASLDSSALTAGWNPPEHGVRWTDGAGVLDIAGVRVLGFVVAMAGEYWAEVPNLRAGAR